VLPYIEWGINRQVIARCRNYLQLHAATLAKNGSAIILAGNSGAGKSTLAAALFARGWTYLCDEFAMINPATLFVHAFPKALCIKSGSFDVVKRLGLPLWHKRYYVRAYKGPVSYVVPRSGVSRRNRSSYPVRHVIFPQFTEGATPRLPPLSRAPAAFALSSLVLNRGTFGPLATSIISTIVRNASCFRLQTGPVWETCNLLESLFSECNPTPRTIDLRPPKDLKTAARQPVKHR